MVRRVADDRGESLIEILVAVLVLGLAAVAVTGGLLTAVKMSDIHRKQATTGADVRSYAEAIKRAAAAPGGYKPCATPADYLPVSGTDADKVHFAASDHYTPRVTRVEYWSDTGPGTAWQWTTARPSQDVGLQRVTVQLESDDGRATETSVVVIRNLAGSSSCPAP